MKCNRAKQAKTRTKIIVKQEFVGEQSVAEALLPIICDEISKKQGRTFDNHEPHTIESPQTTVNAE